MISLIIINKSTIRVGLLVLLEASHFKSKVGHFRKLVKIYCFYCIYTRIPVAMLPNSSPPLALRGGSAYGRMSDAAGLLTKKMKINWSDQIQNFKTCRNYIEILIFQIL